ncbi:UbiA family prenyltransferase [Salinicola sp. RZ23]|uniref:UbiA family prenyltransferase n=1 Tax=Salinicola sp. RZ23 TaxID=1949087 RepID=UPI0018E58827|nr:UbiA family prenyltransferase [Salinicola sp. RZ23]
MGSPAAGRHHRRRRADVWLRLGRVSNLPTVWSNALAGALLAGASGSFEAGLVVLTALTLCYLGGMYLNDACDAPLDARERSSRPIPSGEVGRTPVALIGLALLATAVLLLFTTGAAAGKAGLALAAAVLLYDLRHKGVGWSPLVMGSCRLLCYLVAALALGGQLGALVWLGALGLACHVVGLTYAARQEAYDRLGALWPLGVLAVPLLLTLAAVLLLPGPTLLAGLLWLGYLAWGVRCLAWLRRRSPGDVPRAVVGLIAAISLFDAVLIAALGHPLLALLAASAWAATLQLQRLSAGT